ncbi:MAG TPA: metallophosphoesterase, partial [Pyrinomonadaceae bacterium]|nr:metallophosphoesterase [Pyrinomonadaceae bacterium]
DVTFVCLDTSDERRRIDGENFSGRLNENEKNLKFVERCFTESAQNGTPWCIPFGHHPPYSRGDSHGDTSGLRSLVDRVRGKGLRAFFSGHDHNMQYLTKDRTKTAKVQDNNSASDENKCHYFLTGGGSEPRSGRPTKGTKATLRAWGGTDEGDFLLVTIDGGEMTVQPVGESGSPLKLKDRASGDTDWVGPIKVRA